MCDCIDKVNEKLAEHNTELLLNMFGPQRAFIATEKLSREKRGKPAHLMATFCPFCGEKYSDEPPLSVVMPEEEERAAP